MKQRLARLQLPIMYSGPYSYAAAPIESVFAAIKFGDILVGTVQEHGWLLERARGLRVHGRWRAQGSSATFDRAPGPVASV